MAQPQYVVKPNLRGACRRYGIRSLWISGICSLTAGVFLFVRLKNREHRRNEYLRTVDPDALYEQIKEAGFFQRVNDLDELPQVDDFDPSTLNTLLVDNTTTQ